MKLSSKTIQVIRSANVDFGEYDISQDFLLPFVCRPLFQFSFATEEEAIEILLKRFSQRVCRVLRFRDESGVTIQQALFRFGVRSLVHVRNGPGSCAHVYADSAKRAESLERQIQASLPQRKKKPDEPFFYMLRQDGDSMSIEKVINTSAALDEESLQLAYGADASQWIDEFSRQTTAKLGGITILDGPPGTGKSTLIAQLMRRLGQTHVFYVLSVAQHEVLSQSGMVAFWQTQTRRRPNETKVVIMEDAEKILLQRRSDNNEAVSALLNIADGLMGQMLRVHVLCTLNQGMEDLDPAILRPGRLRGYRHIGLLSREEARKLAAKHKCLFQPEENRDRFTLAEVFHGHAYQQPPARKMGFGTGASFFR